MLSDVIACSVGCRVAEVVWRWRFFWHRHQRANMFRLQVPFAMLHKNFHLQTMVQNTPHSKYFSSANKFAKMLDIKASKNVRMSFATSWIRSQKNCRPTCNLWAKGNVPRSNWPFMMFEQMSSYISYYATLPQKTLQLITISATRLNLLRSNSNDCINRPR